MHPKSSLIGLAAAAILLVGCAPISYGAPSEGVQRSLIQRPHIIEGEYVGIEKVPFQVSIELLTLHGCGGSIISDSWILTAAHCVDSSISGPNWLKRIRVGSTLEIPIIGWSGKTYGIAAAVPHEKFNINTIDYDIGLINLNAKIEFGDRVATIALPPIGTNEDTFVNFSETGVTSGWGLTSRNGFWASLWLKKVTLPLIDRQTCVDLQKDEKIQITPRMICGGGNGKGGACHGDSGGPFVYKNTVIGVVSWGIRCNDNRLPSVFANVLDPEIRDFIKNRAGV